MPVGSNGREFLKNVITNSRDFAKEEQKSRGCRDEKSTGDCGTVVYRQEQRFGEKEVTKLSGSKSMIVLTRALLS